MLRGTFPESVTIFCQKGRYTICKLPAKLATENMIWSQEENRIILVDNLSDHHERVRAREIGQIANRELHHDGGIYHESDPVHPKN